MAKICVAQYPASGYENRGVDTPGTSSRIETQNPRMIHASRGPPRISTGGPGWRVTPLISRKGMACRCVGEGTASWGCQVEAGEAMDLGLVVGNVRVGGEGSTGNEEQGRCQVGGGGGGGGGGV